MSSASGKERRRRDRFPVSVKVRAWWTPEGGGIVSLQARCLDISQTGMRLEVDRPVPARSFVHVESTELHLAGTAVVRHCDRGMQRCTLGLEFVGGTTWRAPQAG